MKALIIDLNNFSRYPTLSVGYLAAVLRKDNFEVEVCSPLNFGVHGFPRTVRERPWQRYAEFLNFCAAVSKLRIFQELQRKLKSLYRPGGNQDKKTFCERWANFYK